MKILGETLFDRIRNRIAAPNAIRIIKTLEQAAARGEIDYLTIKEASELMERYKLEARIAIRTYRRTVGRSAVAEMLTPLQSHEKDILRQHARATAALYIDAMRDFRDLCRLAGRHASERLVAFAGMRSLAMVPYRDNRFYAANDHNSATSQEVGDKRQ